MATTTTMENRSARIELLNRAYYGAGNELDRAQKQFDGARIDHLNDVLDRIADELKKLDA